TLFPFFLAEGPRSSRGASASPHFRWLPDRSYALEALWSRLPDLAVYDDRASPRVATGEVRTSSTCRCRYGRAPENRGNSASPERPASESPAPSPNAHNRPSPQNSTPPPTRRAVRPPTVRDRDYLFSQSAVLCTSLNPLALWHTPYSA